MGGGGREGGNLVRYVHRPALLLLLLLRLTTSSQKRLRGWRAARLRPVSKVEPRVAATRAPMAGWEVMPAMASTATSTMSAPASAAYAWATGGRRWVAVRPTQEHAHT